MDTGISVLALISDIQAGGKCTETGHESSGALPATADRRLGYAFYPIKVRIPSPFGLVTWN